MMPYLQDLCRQVILKGHQNSFLLHFKISRQKDLS